MISSQHPAGITTLRRLQTAVGGLPSDAELSRLAAARPVTLMLPCHARDLDTESLAGIVRELASAPWISRFIVGLDGVEESGLAAARESFAGLAGRVSFLWTDSPEVTAIEDRLKEVKETTAAGGKGRNVWLGLGLALAWADSAAPGIVAVHDCDIRAYSRELPARLCLPLLRPEFGFRFAKGFYARHSDRLHGRLMRLLVRPLLQAMEMRAGPVPGLQFLNAFRYPLAGETAMDLAVAQRLAVTATWGLEIGLLDEVRRQLPPSAICQSGLCAAYDHKHQDLSPDDPGAGLHRMAREVAATLLGTISGGSYPWRDEILVTWQACAADALRQAEAESFLNGLDFHRDQEALAVRTFGRALESALELPGAPALLPSWASAERACPGILDQLAAGARGA
ncbi:MAG: glycosyl transferase [Verrucomicrobiota bacterium]